MRVLFVLASLAIGGAIAQSAVAQGPVRQGLRRTGEIAVQGTQRVVQGAGQVVQGAGRATVGVAQGAADVTRGVVGGAADVTRGVVQGTARGIGAGVNAITPGLPLQARAGATLSAADQARDARWRFNRHNGEWWYYSPQNSWMYHRNGQWNQFSQDSFQPNSQFGGQYASGYRGVEGDMGYADQGYADQGYGQQNYQGQAYTLHRDSYGREFICDNGRRVYVDSQSGQQYGTAYRGMDGQQYQGQQFEGQQNGMTPTPAIPMDPNAQGSTNLQGSTNIQGQSTQQSTLQGQTSASGQVGQQGQVTAQGQAGAAATTPSTPATSTAPTTPSASDSNAGELAPESPRDVLQNSTRGSLGTVEPGQTAR